MASSSNRGTKEILCRYFANNACSKGADCPFSHDRNAKPDMVCRYYLAGSCVYGDRCRYDHKRPAVLPRETEEASSVSKEAKSKLVANTAVLKDEAHSTNTKTKFNPDAEVFVPSWMKQPSAGGKTFADAAGSIAFMPLCPYFENGFCEKGTGCRFVHGLMCEICGKAALHPADEEQCRNHRQTCAAARQAAIEMALAEERSASKVCGICMENVWERQARFGILQRCKHCFCLDCIRKWRSNRNDIFEKEVLRCCPECRVHSDFVIPARYWVEDAEEKQQLIAHYRESNKKIQCKYVRGNDISGCPFGNKCFFKHELPDGTIAEGESPRLMRKSRRINLGVVFAPDSDSDSDFDFDDLFSPDIGDSDFDDLSSPDVELIIPELVRRLT